MMNMLSAIFIIFNFLHILPNESVRDINSQLQHEEHLQVPITPPELHTQPEPQLHLGRHQKKHHKEHQGPRPGLHPKHLPIVTQPLTEPQPQPLPIPTPLPTEPLPKPLPIPTPLPTEPLPKPLSIPTPLPTQPLPKPQVPGQLPLLPIPTPEQVKPLLPNKPSSLRDMYNAMTSSKPLDYLAAHNEFRAKMGVPPLQWDKKLEDYALAYGTKRAADCRLQHSLGPYGENLFWEQYEESGPQHVVKSFTDEQQNYDLTKGECKCQQETSTCMCGHFTAIIWKVTERVGCAEIICEAEKGKLVVCSYDPPGNVIGQDPLHAQ